MERQDLTAFIHHTETTSDALLRAIREGWTLNTYADAIENGVENCGFDHADDVAGDDMSLVYLTR